MYHDKTCFMCGKYTSNIGSVCICCQQAEDELTDRPQKLLREVSLVIMKAHAILNRIELETGVSFLPSYSRSRQLLYQASFSAQMDLRSRVIASRKAPTSSVGSTQKAAIIPFFDGATTGAIVVLHRALRGEGAIVVHANGGRKRENIVFPIVWTRGFTNHHMQDQP